MQNYLEIEDLRNFKLKNRYYLDWLSFVIMNKHVLIIILVPLMIIGI